MPSPSVSGSKGSVPRSPSSPSSEPSPSVSGSKGSVPSLISSLSETPSPSSSSSVLSPTPSPSVSVSSSGSSGKSSSPSGVPSPSVSGSKGLVPSLISSLSETPSPSSSVSALSPVPSPSVSVSSLGSLGKSSSASGVPSPSLSGLVSSTSKTVIRIVWEALFEVKSMVVTSTSYTLSVSASVGDSKSGALIKFNGATKGAANEVVELMENSAESAPPLIYTYATSLSSIVCATVVFSFTLFVVVEL